MLDYAVFAERFGWTKTQVDAEPHSYIELIIPVTNLIRKVRDG